MSINKKGYRDCEDLYIHNEKLVYKFIRKYTEDEDLIKELSQIVWYKVCENFDNIPIENKLAAQKYIWLIARSTVYDYFYVEKREQEIIKEVAYLYGNENNNFVDSDVNCFLNRELEEYLDEAIHLLKDSERDLIKLKYMDKLSSEEIGSLLGISDALVRVRLQRIRLKLEKGMRKLQGRDENE